MKKRILSFIMACLCLTCISVSGCRESDTQSPTKRIPTELEKVTNVFKTRSISPPENYTPLSKNISVYDGRLYMLCVKTIPPDTSDIRNHIYSVDVSGENPELEAYPSVGDYRYPALFYVQPDGARIFFESEYDFETNTAEYFLRKNDISGKEVFAVSLTELFPSEEFGNVSKILFDSENIMYFITERLAVVISSDGEKHFSVSLPDGFIEAIPLSGNVALKYMDKMVTYINCIDAKGQKLDEEEADIPYKIVSSSTGIISVLPSDDSGYLWYYTTSTGISGMTKDGGEEILNWMNSDMSPDEVSEVTVIDRDNVYYYGYDLFTYTYKYTLLIRVPDEEIVPKCVIELAYVDTGPQKTVIKYAAKFNRESEYYRIKLIDYAQPALRSAMTPQELLNLDIVSGNIPDMFILEENNLIKDYYEDKGLFCDLYEFMDSDTEMTRDKFLKCALIPFEKDRKLYSITNKISIKTIVGKTENIDNSSWGMSDFLKLAENKNQNTRIFADESRNYMLDILFNSFGEFIDQEKGTCSFQSDTFIKLIEYIASLPSASEFSGSYDRDYRNGNILLKELYLFDFSTYIRQKFDFGTEDITFIGYPGVDGGAVVNPALSYAISDKSSEDVKHGAWEFIKYILKDEVLTDESGGIFCFPVTYTAYQKAAEKDMLYYYIILPDGGTQSHEIELTKADADKAGGILTRITKDDTDEILRYLETITQSNSLDKTVEDIIREELDIFFANAKTAQETANIIQSRVSIYISESH